MVAMGSPMRFGSQLSNSENAIPLLLTLHKRQHGLCLAAMDAGFYVHSHGTVRGMYCNSVLITGCRLGGHLYSPDVMDGDSEAHRGSGVAHSLGHSSVSMALGCAGMSSVSPAAGWLWASPVATERTPAGLGLWPELCPALRPPQELAFRTKQLSS